MQDSSYYLQVTNLVAIPPPFVMIEHMKDIVLVYILKMANR